MAKVLFNPIMEQIRGKIGELVFRRFENRIIVARKPDVSGRVPTAGQAGVRMRFREAARYANNVMADPERRLPYEPVAAKHGKSLRMVIMSDYLNPPEVDAISVVGYHGRMGDPIDVQATDDVAVTGVLVTIRDEAGAVVEQGAATLAAANWRYVATVTVQAGESVTIDATATDLAKQTGTLRVPIVVTE